jgi:integrase
MFSKTCVFKKPDPAIFYLFEALGKNSQGQSAISVPRDTYGSHPVSCPVRTLRTWLEQSGITEGFLFPALGRRGKEAEGAPITDHQLARIIKRLASQAGLDPALFSGHSLRSGLATSAAEGGASERSIMEQTRHRSLKQVRKYIRRGSLFQDNAAARSGL